MKRRNFLAAAGPLLVKPALALPPKTARLKITGVRVVRLRLIKEAGSLEPAWNPGARVTFRAGGGSFTEILTDQGLTGIGPGIDPASVAGFEAKLVGKDPFDTENHIALLRYDAAGGVYRGPANLDIALWDLIGKALRPAVI
jgi:L-alanine-DL-glutamate epimerase-like enolase superfamily enzyme